MALGDHTGRCEEQEGVMCCPSCLLLQDSCRVSLGPAKSLHDSVTQNEGPPFLGAGRMVLCSCERSPFRAGMLPQCMKVTALSSSPSQHWACDAPWETSKLWEGGLRGGTDRLLLFIYFVWNPWEPVSRLQAVRGHVGGGNSSAWILLKHGGGDGEVRSLG